MDTIVARNADRKKLGKVFATHMLVRQVMDLGRPGLMAPLAGPAGTLEDQPSRLLPLVAG